MSGLGLIPEWRFPNAPWPRLSARLRSILGHRFGLFRSHETVRETLIVRMGPVEVRQTQAVWALETLRQRQIGSVPRHRLAPAGGLCQGRKPDGDTFARGVAPGADGRGTRTLAAAPLLAARRGGVYRGGVPNGQGSAAGAEVGDRGGAADDRETHAGGDQPRRGEDPRDDRGFRLDADRRPNGAVFRRRTGSCRSSGRFEVAVPVAIRVDGRAS